MIRPILTEAVLFATPFALYALYLLLSRATVFDPVHWPWSRIGTLAICSLVLMIVSFFVLAESWKHPPGSVYVPARMENGVFVPGHFK